MGKNEDQSPWKFDWIEFKSRCQHPPTPHYFRLPWIITSPRFDACIRSNRSKQPRKKKPKKGGEFSCHFIASIRCVRVRYKYYIHLNFRSHQSQQLLEFRRYAHHTIRIKVTRTKYNLVSSFYCPCEPDGSLVLLRLNAFSTEILYAIGWVKYQWMIGRNFALIWNVCAHVWNLDKMPGINQINAHVFSTSYKVFIGQCSWNLSIDTVSALNGRELSFLSLVICWNYAGARSCN